MLSILTYVANLHQIAVVNVPYLPSCPIFIHDDLKCGEREKEDLCQHLALSFHRVSFPDTQAISDKSMLDQQGLLTSIERGYLRSSHHKFLMTMNLTYILITTKNVVATRHTVVKVSKKMRAL